MSICFAVMRKPILDGENRLKLQTKRPIKITVSKIAVWLRSPLDISTSQGQFEPLPTTLTTSP
ncbi:hypothetical protein SAMN05444358_1088 [Ruegeria halocynthiae]|uniref:Uncharacterized protein n=1 Tax=Ruegeria halocynthiae TaxID=985054 RepID=A0A1H3D9C1_9RHOB|nr:hypothetical protein SAMN05444358_1088 [Ruegeria halocynthiae]